jgi:hypothetical protein
VIAPPVNEREVPFVGAVSTVPGGEPQPLIVAGLKLLIVTLAGRGSTMEKFVRSVSPGATISILRSESPLGLIVAGENDFAPVI